MKRSSFDIDFLDMPFEQYATSIRTDSHIEGISIAFDFSFFFRRDPDVNVIGSGFLISDFRKTKIDIEIVGIAQSEADEFRLAHLMSLCDCSDGFLLVI